MTKHINICRICLEGHSNINIFRTTALNDLVANLLIECADVEVSFDDRLPHVICSNCFEVLKTSCELRKQIRNSDIVLRALFEDDTTSEIVVTKRKNKEFSWNATENSYSPPNDKFKAEIVPPKKSNIPIVQVDNTNTDPDFNSTEDTDAHFESDHEVAGWILNPKQQLIAEPTKESTLAENVVYNCCMCSDVFYEFELLKQHSLTHKRVSCISSSKLSLSKRYFKCNICFKMFNTEHLLKKHQTAFQRLVTCAICGARTLPCNASQHMKRHENDLVECDVCHKMYKKIYIAEHKKNVHCGPKVFLCDMCPDKAFGTKILLRTHICRLHDSTYKKPMAGACKECGREFESKSKLQSHMYIHTGQKRFTCKYCEAKFMHTTDYRRHVWTHEGSPYSCKKCNKYLDRPSLLKLHEANGCSKTPATACESKKEDKEQNVSKRGSSPSVSCSDETFVSNVLSAIAVESAAGILTFNYAELDM